MDRILALAELCLPQHVAAADRSLIGSIGVDGIGEAFERWIGDAAYRFTETEFMRLSELVCSYVVLLGVVCAFGVYLMVLMM